MQLGQHSATCFPPNLGAKPPYSHFEAMKSVVCFFFFTVFFPGSRAIGLAREAAQRLLIGSPHRGCSPVLPLPSPPLISLQIKEG